VKHVSSLQCSHTIA